MSMLSDLPPCYLSQLQFICKYFSLTSSGQMNVLLTLALRLTRGNIMKAWPRPEGLLCYCLRLDVYALCN